MEGEVPARFKASLEARLAGKEKLTMAYTRLSVVEAFPIEAVEQHGFSVRYGRRP